MKDQTNKDINNNNEGVYLVNFNILYKNNKPDCLTYSYLRYNTIFTEALVHYIDQFKINNIKFLNLNNRLFVLEDSFLKYSSLERYENAYNYLKLNSYYLTLDNKYKFNLIECLSLLSCNKPTYLDLKEISEFIHILYNGNNNKIIDFYKNNSTIEVLKNKWFNINLNEHFNKNIIFNFFFLVKDLDSLLNKLKSLNMGVNGGPQSKRAMCSLTDANILRIDSCFRQSLYLGSKSYKTDLTNRDFHFKNIHINLGSVR